MLLVVKSPLPSFWDLIYNGTYSQITPPDTMAFTGKTSVYELCRDWNIVIPCEDLKSQVYEGQRPFSIWYLKPTNLRATRMCEIDKNTKSRSSQEDDTSLVWWSWTQGHLDSIIYLSTSWWPSILSFKLLSFSFGNHTIILWSEGSYLFQPCLTFLLGIML